MNTNYITKEYAYLLIGEDLQKALNAKIEKKVIKGICFFIINDDFFVKNGRCSCNKLCWHIVATCINKKI